MRNKRLILLLCLLLAATLFISGCPPFRRPAPERQPVPQQPVPQQPAPQQPDPQQPVPPPAPGVPAPAPGVPAPGRPAQPRAMDLAERVADLAAKVEGVDRSVALVIANLALVGITLERDDAANRDETAIKREVSRQIEEREPGIVNAYVSANPDIVRQIQEITRGVQRGEPVTTFFDQITEVLRRMRAETDKRNN